VRWRPAVVIGLAAVAGVEAGVVVAEHLPEHALKRSFGALMIVVAAQVAWRARRRRPADRVQPDQETEPRTGQ
jgi:uncharacterized membrane protein YfcA